MSSQFYDYLSNKLLDYFEKNQISNGERFFISLDEDEQVMSFYNSLKKIGNAKYSCSKFSYIHDKSKKQYDTFSIKINNVNFVISESISVNVDYLVTLRNQVTSQQGVWENTALLIICKEGIDSINKGMRDLQKEGMPLNVKSISNNLENEIDSSKKLSPPEKQIIKFVLDKQEENIFQTTIWDYETILAIIIKGNVSDENLFEFNLFKDEQLHKYTPSKMYGRLEENYDMFDRVSKIPSDKKKDKLEKMVSSRGVELLSKDDWYTVEWKLVEKYKEEYKQQEKPLKYIENHEKISENGLVYWERPNSNKGSGKRIRNIIVFNTNSSSELSLKFNFDQTLENDNLDEKSRGKGIAKTKRKSIFVNFSLNRDGPTFESISYVPKNKSGSDFSFRIVVLDFKPEMIETIKSRYRVNVSRKHILVINDEDDFDIEFGMNSSKKREKSILEEWQDIYLHEEESIIISEQSPAWENDELKFILNYNNASVKVLVKNSDNISRVNSYKIWNLKRSNMQNFIFNGVKAVQEVNNFYIRDEFKEFLKMEREIIKNDIFYAKINTDGSLKKIELLFSEELKNAYLDIFEYYKTFDNSPEDNLPSLVYLNNDLKELYEKFIHVFNREISEIEEESCLSDYKFKKDLLKLGRVETNDRIMYSPLSPLNIAYQLEIAKQCKNEELPDNVIKNLVPNNLIPYIYSDDGKDLFRPIYQEDAHEWIIYEKSEDVSIGTTNVFISSVVNEKLTQFVEHFNYLFSFNNYSPLRINLINIKDDKEVVKGIFDFIRERLPDKGKNKKIIPLEIHIYNNAGKSSFDDLFDCQSDVQLLEEFNFKKNKIKSNIFDPIDIIHMIQNNISYYKHPFNKEEYEYAHLSFYKVESHNDTANIKMNKIETGLSLNGLLSSVSSTTNHSEYRTGFGTNNILNYDNLLIQTVINLNELAENSKKFGKNTYLKNTSVITTVELEEDNIDLLYDKSHWVTFIEPTFGIEYFDNDDDLIIIHYSDQYSSSNKYDTITVTNKTTQYEEIIGEFLHSKNVNVDDEGLYHIIRLFNSINGEWLLRIISNSGHYDKEKLSIISAIKYCLAILNHEDIIWIPVSMEEVLRIAGNIKLDKKEGIFAELKGSHSDDLLFIGVKLNTDNKIEIIFYPIEVKIGQNDSSVMDKGKNQLKNTYNLLKTQLQKIDNDDSGFRNKFFRNFFIKILLANEQKFVTNHIWDEKGMERIEDFKSELLNDEYDINYGLEDYIGIGSVFSFKTSSYHSYIYMEGDKQIIELPEDFAYSGLAKSIEQIHQEIQSDSTDIISETLLSHRDISEIRSNITDLNDSNKDIEMSDENEYLDNNEGFDKDLTKDESVDNLVEENEAIIFEEQNDKLSDSDSDIKNENNSNESSFDNSNIRALIGTQKGYSHKVYWEFGHPDLANRHMSIQGKSGQGKSYFIQRMLKELSNQGIPSIIIDYTDGFKQSKLEPEFKESLGDKIVQHKVLFNKFPLNPFKKYLIEDDGEYFPEMDITVAGRFKNILNTVYNFGGQQQMEIYNATLNGLSKYGDEMDLIKFKDELINLDSSHSTSTLNKLIQFLDINPFKTEDFDWSYLDNADGKVMIIQLSGLPRDIQIIVSEFILLDLWNYKLNNGDEDNPFIVVLDEAHNLDFGADSPCGKILKEGRKFGWSGWFATQSMKGSMRPDEIANLANAEEKIYFHPTDVSAIAKELSKDAEDRKRFEKELSQLNKGYCIVQGSTINSDGKLYHSNPLPVKIDRISIENKNDSQY